MMTSQSIVHTRISPLILTCLKSSWNKRHENKIGATGILFKCLAINIPPIVCGWRRSFHGWPMAGLRGLSLVSPLSKSYKDRTASREPNTTTAAETPQSRTSDGRTSDGKTAFSVHLESAYCYWGSVLSPGLFALAAEPLMLGWGLG